MSRYGDSDWKRENLFFSMRDFLEENESIAALMQIVYDVIEDYELSQGRK